MKPSRHNLHIMYKNNIFALFGTDSVDKSSIYILQGNSYDQVGKKVETLLLDRDSTFLKRKELINKGFKDFYQGIINGLVVQRIYEWLKIVSENENQVSNYLLIKWREDYDGETPSKFLKINYESGNMSLKFKDLDDPNENYEPNNNFELGITTGELIEDTFLDNDNYWNQEDIDILD